MSTFHYLLALFLLGTWGWMAAVCFWLALKKGGEHG